MIADPVLERLLAAWLPQRRWYPAKGGGAGARITGGFELARGRADVALRVAFVEIDDAGTPVTLQVPVSVRAGSLGADPGALIGRADAAWIYDGTHDRDFVAAWLDLVSGVAGMAESAGTDPAPLVAWCSDRLRRAHPGRPGGELGAVRVVAGEQSNTSVVVRDGAGQLMLKFYRVLQPGRHPEVEAGRALAALDNPHVPTLHGAVQFRMAAGLSTLGVVHSFVAGGRDGWELALTAARAGTDFQAEARALGAAVGSVHADLLASLGPSPADAAGPGGLVEAIIDRLDWAWAAARTAVGPYDDALEGVKARLRQITDLPDCQRIHGDLHLGQALQAGGGGRWYVLDFEGEPLRPLAERGLPDLPLRDVVGMLRSFDYAAAQSDDGTGSTVTWARRASAAFLAGYGLTRPGTVDTRSALFEALWLDKALYEVVYELRNRPDWIWVPVRAVREILGTEGKWC